MIKYLWEFLIETSERDPKVQYLEDLFGDMPLRREYVHGSSEFQARVALIKRGIPQDSIRAGWRVSK